MKRLNAYLGFDGKCKEALDFYVNCFDGEITSLQTFGDVGNKNEDLKDRVMHAEFKAEGIHFMASDGNGNMDFVVGNMITLSISLDEKEEQIKIFDALSKDGVVMMKLQDTFWGTRLGMLKDKYNINWMLNCEIKK